jgi:hypothetical protein
MSIDGDGHREEAPLLPPLTRLCLDTEMEMRGLGLWAAAARAEAAAAAAVV